MTVHVENIGGSTSTPGRVFPPKGTQVEHFLDTFRRPDSETLGSQWGVSWQYCDYPYSNSGIIGPPWPQNAAISPKIEGNECVWFSRRAVVASGGGPYWQGIALTTAWPWPLAWISQGQFDHYSQVVIDPMFPSVEVTLGCVFSGNSGSITPDHYLQQADYDDGPNLGFRGQYGYYSLNVSGTTLGGSCAIVYNFFGTNPSTTPTGLRGHAGMNFLVLASQTLAYGLPAQFRLEARRVGNHWNLKGLQNDVLIIEADHGNLIQGMPVMTCDTGAEAASADPNNLARVSYYRGGWIE